MWEYVVPGISDEYFEKGNFPMTKEEIRVISISKLRLKRDSVVWDIGAGTGSVSIEAAILSKEGTVYAIEKEEEGIKLIEKNASKFAASNVVTVLGEAPEALFSLPQPDRVFIGGSGEKLQDILKVVDEKLQIGGILVANAITLETTWFLTNFLKKRPYKVEVLSINVAVSKKAGDKTMMIARNPIYIITGQKEG
ncbi:precorrin-6Y C5,15-methyltransferase (decarboxylating) subunit CbiT [Caldanaerobacter sp.]|uniref:precorrin-6Y C5,15-methyltransferase (decarboxylating) subunit CbiT n=1 Tax=Caldanaerobacter sp. TaxID=2930036 RepID=UPI003C7094BA